jgi:hypothetical protein
MSSNLYAKSDLHDVLTSTVSNGVSDWLTVNSPVNMRGGADNVNTATSDVFMSQMNTNEVNQLVNMLTSDVHMIGGTEIIDDTVRVNTLNAQTLNAQKLNANTFSATSDGVPDAINFSVTSDLNMTGGARKSKKGKHYNTQALSATSEGVPMTDNFSATSAMNMNGGGMEEGTCVRTMTGGGVESET